MTTATTTLISGMFLNSKVITDVWAVDIFRLTIDTSNNTQGARASLEEVSNHLHKTPNETYKLFYICPTEKTKDMINLKSAKLLLVRKESNRLLKVKHRKVMLEHQKNQKPPEPNDDFEVVWRSNRSKGRLIWLLAGGVFTENTNNPIVN